MKLRGTIKESILPTDKSVIVGFEGDKEQQHFEIHCTFSPFYHKMRKWDTWDFVLKLKSEIFVDPKSGKKSYFTHLICTKATLFHELGSIGKSYRDK